MELSYGVRRSGKSYSAFKGMYLSEKKVCTFYTFNLQAAQYQKRSFIEFLKEVHSKFGEVPDFLVNKDSVKVRDKLYVFKSLQLDKGDGYSVLDEANLIFDHVTCTPHFVEKLGDHGDYGYE